VKLSELLHLFGPTADDVLAICGHATQIETERQPDISGAAEHLCSKPDTLFGYQVVRDTNGCIRHALVVAPD
jgi:hypothetical protein